MCTETRQSVVQTQLPIWLSVRKHDLGPNVYRDTPKINVVQTQLAFCRCDLGLNVYRDTIKCGVDTAGCPQVQPRSECVQRDTPKCGADIAVCLAVCPYVRSRSECVQRHAKVWCRHSYLSSWLSVRRLDLGLNVYRDTPKCGVDTATCLAGCLSAGVIYVSMCTETHQSVVQTQLPVRRCDLGLNVYRDTPKCGAYTTTCLAGCLSAGVIWVSMCTETRQSVVRTQLPVRRCDLGLNVYSDTPKLPI